MTDRIIPQNQHRLGIVTGLLFPVLSMFLGCTMAKNFTEVSPDYRFCSFLHTQLFPSEEYISDYESETASNADTGNTIRLAVIC